VFLESIMSTRFLKIAALLALAACCTLALADPPTRVGRVSLAEGEVSIVAEAGDQAGGALLNWPVTSHNQISTGRGARAEFRVGSTAVRLDADSLLEIDELDDEHLRLHLQYGSASVRIRNPEVLAGFELSTPQAHVRMQQPGRLRVDAERVPDTSVVNVFDGVALVEAGGSQLTVRAGRRAEIENDDVRTALALRDSFDDWAQLRDQRDERSTSARYVTSEMTGYEELDQNGIWRDDTEYGPLWIPRGVPLGWAPYRDGRWTWVEPWGWTWIDDAPWGYAPFHYGRWVHVNQRWAWAPGRRVSHPVWAPALVGWVGGGGWNLSFGSHGGRRAPAQGWYPLTPRERFVPGYHLSQEHLGQLNSHVRPDGRHEWREREQRHEGLTVVPHDQFGQRGTVVVRNAPHAVLPPLALQTAPAGTPPPRGFSREANRGPRDDQRFERDQMIRNRGQRPEPGVLRSAPPPQPLIIGSPAAGAPPPFQHRDPRRSFEDAPRHQQPPAPVAPMPAAIAPLPPVPPPAAEPAQDQRFNRPHRGDGERERRLREPDAEPPMHMPGQRSRPFREQRGPAMASPMVQPITPPPAAPAPVTMIQPMTPPPRAPAPVRMPQPMTPPPPAPAPVGVPQPIAAPPQPIGASAHGQAPARRSGQVEERRRHGQLE
jgi:hypothetical protein